MGFSGRLEDGALVGAPAPERIDRCLVLFHGYLGRVDSRAEAPGSEAGAECARRVLVRAYRRWGPRLSEHLSGQFAAAIYDESERRLFLVRDRLGVCPLFYSAVGPVVSFATHLADLISGLTALREDEEYFADYLASGQPASDRTPYTTVKRLLPGEVLRIGEAGELRLTSSPFLPSGATVEADDDELADRFRELLRDAVADACRPRSGRLGAELSGGLDSSSVACVATAIGRPLEAVSVVYPLSATADEREWMWEVIRQEDLPWHQVDGDRRTPYAALPDVPLGEPTPYATWFSLQEAQRRLYERRGIDVVLTGMGGDAVLWGDSPAPYQLADRLLGLEPTGLVGELRRWRTSFPARRSLLYWLLRGAGGPLVRFFGDRRIAAQAALPDWLSRSFVQRMDLIERSRCRRAPRCETPGGQAFLETLWDLSLLIGSSREQYLRNVDFRHPLLDYRLVRFMSAIPWRLRFTPREDRVLQRRALCGVLPEPVRLRTDKAGPQQVWERGLKENTDVVSSLVERPRIVAAGYVDAERWDRAVRQARYGRTQSQRHFEAALELEIWLRSREA